MDTKLYTTTKYHPQTTRQVDRFHCTFVARRRYIDGCQQNWEFFVQLLIFAYNMWVHRTSGASPSSLMSSRMQLWFITMSETKTTVNKYSTISPALEKKVMEHLQQLLHKGGVKTCRARLVCESNFDRRVNIMRRFAANFMAYVDSSSTQKRRLKKKTTNEYPSVKIRPKKSVPYCEMRLTSLAFIYRRYLNSRYRCSWRSCSREGER